MTLTSEQIQAYQRDGFLHIKNVIPQSTISSYVESIKALIKARAQSENIELEKSDDIDTLFNSLCKANRKLGGDIYDHVKELPEFTQMMSHENILGVAKKILTKNTVQIATSQCVFRIDRPEEDKYGFGWHQDYWYNCLTPDAVTCWYPLTEVTQNEGALQLLRGSHSKLLPVEVPDPNNSAGNMALIFKFPDSYKMNEADIITAPVKPGDALFFHSYLLHKSGLNRSNRSRWSVQYRYADFLSEEYTKRGWRHGTFRGKVTFLDLHPNMVIKN